MTTTTPEPHNKDAERSVLGSILLDADSIHSIIPKLQAEDFYDPVHRAIYSAMCKLYESGTVVDMVTVADSLSDDVNVKQCGGSAYLAELAVDVPSSLCGERHAEILLTQSRRRQLLKFSKKVIGLVEEGNSSAEELVESVEQELLKLSYTSVQHKPTGFDELCMSRFDHYEAIWRSDDPGRYGIQTGFPQLDQMMVGLQAGDMMVIGGRPHMGKTAIALQIARHVTAEQRKRVAIFSLEMNKEQLFDRLFSAFHQIEEHKLSRDNINEEELQRIANTMEEIHKLPLFIDDDPDASITNLRSKARRHKMEHGIDLLIIDYLQLIQVPTHVDRENRTEKLRYISQHVKSLAREIDAPVIALSQLSRGPESRIDKRPLLSDLRESGAIEQDADYVLLLYREGYYDEDCDRPDITDLYLRKNRPHGATGQVEVSFSKDTHRYEEVRYDTAC